MMVKKKKKKQSKEQRKNWSKKWTRTTTPMFWDVAVEVDAVVLEEGE